jgi:hypothetical protein
LSLPSPQNCHVRARGHPTAIGGMDSRLCGNDKIGMERSRASLPGKRRQRMLAMH